MTSAAVRVWDTLLEVYRLLVIATHSNDIYVEVHGSLVDKHFEVINFEIVYLFTFLRALNL